MPLKVVILSSSFKVRMMDPQKFCCSNTELQTFVHQKMQWHPLPIYFEHKIQETRITFHSIISFFSFANAYGTTKVRYHSSQFVIYC